MGTPDFAVPALETLLALQVIFGGLPRDFFGPLYISTEESVMRRAAEFDRRLDGKGGHVARTQRRLLKAIAFRAALPADPV